MTSISAFQLRTWLTSSTFKHRVLKSRLPTVDWGTFDHFLLPGSKVTDISNSWGQRHVIHKHRHKDLILLLSAKKLYANKKSYDNIALHCPDFPAFGDLQEKPLSICCQNTKSKRGTAYTVCSCSSVVTCAAGEQHTRVLGPLASYTATRHLSDHGKSACLLETKFWLDRSTCVVFRSILWLQGVSKVCVYMGGTGVKWGKRI